MILNRLTTCRICLTVSDKVFSLFDGDQATRTLQDKVMFCAHIEMPDHKNCPSVICESCKTTLNICYDFVLKCKLSEKTILEYIRNNASPSLQGEINNLKQEKIDWDSDNSDNNIDTCIDTNYLENASDDHCEDVKLIPRLLGNSITLSLDKKLKPLVVDPGILVKDESPPAKLTYKECNKKSMRATSCEAKKELSPIKLESQTSADYEWLDVKAEPCKTAISSKSKDKNKNNFYSKSYKKQKHEKSHNKDMKHNTNLKNNDAKYSIKIEATSTRTQHYQCTYCPSNFSDNHKFILHLAKCHNVKQKPEARFTCEVCGNQFVRRRDVVIHMRRHTGETPYACTFCPRRFTQIGPLIRHKRTHTGERPYACLVCNKRFADKTTLKMHSNVHSEERNFICTICGKAVKSKNSLIKHVELHSNQKSHVCEQCGMTFSVKGNLKLHAKKVHSEKSGMCPICERMFSDIDKHMRRHTGEAPFHCDICNRKFTQKSGLTMHINKHKNAQKFKCTIDECSMAFPLKFMLDFHIMKFHTNETPYVCPHCGRGFFRTGDLTKHIRGTHQSDKNKNDK